MWTRSSAKPNKEVYGNLPRATMKNQERRMRLAGHIHRHPELVANRLLLWEPTHGVRRRGRLAKTCVDSLRADTGLNDTGEMGGLMADRVLRRQRSAHQLYSDAGAALSQVSHKLIIKYIQTIQTLVKYNILMGNIIFKLVENKIKREDQRRSEICLHR